MLATTFHTRLAVVRTKISMKGSQFEKTALLFQYLPELWFAAAYTAWQASDS